MANAFASQCRDWVNSTFWLFTVGELDIVWHRRPRQQGGRDNSMSSHSIRTQSNSALHDGPRASVGRQGGEATTILDLAMVTAVVSAIAYIAAIMIGWL